uniref:Beta-fructofuranosidase n=1 Tax=Chenopodium quinoa TaxID=63459 RepID=A0A803LD98_CHEQI
MHSGSTTIRPGNKPAIIFTLHTPNLEVQEIAVPKNFSDPYLKEWVVIPQNPVIIPTQEIDPLNFRDPTTAWILPDSTWRVIVGSVSNNQGMALLYKSNDFIQWVKVNHSLYSEQNSEMWECPDFFPVYKNDNRNEFNANDGAKYVLKASLAANQHDVYSIGTYDLKNDQFVPDQGFVNDSSLREKPVSLRDKVISGGSIIEVSNITAAQADVEVLINFSDLKNAEKFESNWTNNPQLACNQNGLSKNGEFGPFGLLILASEGLEEYTAVYFRIFYDNNKHVILMCSDQTRSSLNTNPEKTLYGAFMDVDPTSEGLALRVLIDHSVVESYGGKGKAVITARVYPTIAIDENAHLYVFNNGTNSIQFSRLSTWSMNKAQQC